MRIRANKHAIPAMLLAGVVAIASTAAAAGQDSTRVRHFIDTATDRVPATTAFPKYPSIARRDRIEGDATVCFKIRANGRVSRARFTARWASS